MTASKKKNQGLSMAGVYESRKLIARLSVNDFKTKFAGSYLGIIWAFVQPVITILVYWFVFEKGMKPAAIRDAAGTEVPYVLWLIAGMVPWFFFSDALSGGTRALLDYSYLVKKVVFKIDILPIVKIVSAVFVHLFFLAFAVLLYTLYGYYPDVYTLQVLYYSICLFVLVMGISYLTSAVVVFFRDLNQVINIVLQVGVWVTPIMWNIDTMDISPVLKNLLKLNPLYYIVQGYRDAFIGKVAFFERWELTIYFWVVTIVFVVLGTHVFKKLRMHFADVL
ncbi:ABC transporter permease [Roseburia sp. BX1005]|uniref:Transport permease protein n=1 Tax=Roseburia zhanii TaxID=2763064 RepID=A0A923LM40_9FIRM|nr:ABC transporter permease [Roseburia zhanii]MBC5712782.1 ABC transporter permease [Roseburia zhanii]OLA86733.1 MAG: teichoic acid ABC transporter permease [Roseburia sp. 40_7]